MRVVVLEDYQGLVERLDAFALTAGHDVVVRTKRPGTLEERAAQIGDAEALVLIRERTPVDDTLLACLPNLRLIVQTGRGLPHVDVEACTRRGIVVCNGSGTPYAAAEMTLALMLAATRHVVTDAVGLRAGEWSTTDGRELHGRVLGIAGYGSIGALVARYGVALGMHVLAWGRAASLERAHADGHEAEPDLDELCRRADVLSLHLKLTASTRGILTSRQLGLMKPDALLVNTARAGLIERGALLAALDAGRPGAAAIDVFDEEPATDDPLVAHPAVLATPHLGYATRETYEAFFGEAFAQVDAFAAGSPTGVVNAETLGSGG
jgi:D-3-phosphoglycerate dehydrogenase